MEHFNGGKQAVDIIGAFDQHLQLASAEAACFQELVGILELVVIGLDLLGIIAHNRSNDLALGKRGTIMDGHNADLVIRILDHDGVKTVALGDDIGHALDHLGVFAAERQGVDALIGDDDELHQVDRVRPFTQDPALRAALTAVLEKTLHILEILRFLVGGEHLGGIEKTAVTGKDVADLALGNGHQGRRMDIVLERP